MCARFYGFRISGRRPLGLPTTVCQMGQCSDICATSVFEVKTSLSGFNRLWGDTRVMWTHFFTFFITSCVSEMAQKWSILGQHDNLSHKGPQSLQMAGKSGSNGGSQRNTCGGTNLQGLSERMAKVKRFLWALNFTKS